MGHAASSTGNSVSLSLTPGSYLVEFSVVAAEDLSNTGVNFVASSVEGISPAPLPFAQTFHPSINQQVLVNGLYTFATDDTLKVSIGGRGAPPVGTLLLAATGVEIQ